MKRKGLGKGRGKGYYNMVIRDPFIHGLSAKGISSYSKLKATAMATGWTAKCDKCGNIQEVSFDHSPLGEKHLCEKCHKYFNVTDLDLSAKGKKKHTRSEIEKALMKLRIERKKGVPVGYNPIEGEYFYATFDAKYRKRIMSPEMVEVKEMKDDLAQEFYKQPFKKLTPDKKSEVNDAYRELVFRLSAKSTREVMRKGFNTVVTWKVNGVPVKAHVKIDKLNPEDILGVPEIVLEDRDGNKLDWVSIDNATGKIIGEGLGEKQPKYKRVLMNPKGQIIPKSEVQYKQRVGEKLKEVSPFSSNIGKNKELKIEKIMPKEEINKYLIESTYQLVGQTDENDGEIYTIAKDLFDKGMVGIVPIVFREGFKKQYGIITPIFKKDRFSVIVRITRARIEPSELSIPTAKAKVKKVKLPTLKTKDPF